MKHWVRWLFILPIKGYKKFISPLLGNNCRFYPTCSEYTILRCNPFCKGGIDPVPPKGKWKNG